MTGKVSQLHYLGIARVGPSLQPPMRTVLVRVLPGLRLGRTPTTATALRNKNALVQVEQLLSPL